MTEQAAMRQAYDEYLRQRYPATVESYGPADEEMDPVFLAGYEAASHRADSYREDAEVLKLTRDAARALWRGAVRMAEVDADAATARIADLERALDTYACQRCGRGVWLSLSDATVVSGMLSARVVRDTTYLLTETRGEAGRIVQIIEEQLDRAAPGATEAVTPLGHPCEFVIDHDHNTCGALETKLFQFDDRYPWPAVQEWRCERHAPSDRLPLAATESMADG